MIESQKMMMNIEEVSKGMVLSGDVCTESGECIFVSGTEVTEKTIEKAKDMGIDCVSVEWPEALLDGVAIVQNSAVEDELNDRFSGVLNYPLMNQLYLTIKKYKMNKLQ